MHIQEPEHIGALRDTLRRFVENEMPRKLAFEWDRDDTYSKEVLAKLAELGLMGITFSEEFGGYGRDIHATMAVIEELSKRSTGIAGPYIMSTCYGGMNIEESGTEEQKREYLPKIAAGELMFSYGLTEPDTGADLAAVRTKARREGDELVINGAKRFCTGAEHADYIFTLVRDEAIDERYKNLNMVIIPANLPGITIEPLQAIAQRGQGNTDVTFEDVRVPVSAILGGEAMWNQGWKTLAGPTLDVEKLEVAAMALGNAEGAMADAWQYSQERIQFGKAICQHQAVRHKLAICKTKLLTARLTLYHATDMANKHQPCSVETSMAKYFVCEEAQKVVMLCQRVMGAYGCVRGDTDMERYVREAQAFPIAGGSSDIQLNNISNRLGLPR